MKSDTGNLGRRFMVGVRGARPGDAKLEADLDACARVGIGGVILFDRDIATGATRNVVSKKQVRDLISHIQTRLGGPVRIGVDQEGGRVARLREAHGFAPVPSAHEVAAMPEAEQRAIARTMAQDLRDVGVDMNFAPCVDLDLGCPVISGLARSYGGFEAVIRSARIVIDELQSAGVSACVKHFPGHGSAPLDSHHELPDVTRAFNADELDVYRALIADGPTPHAVMTAHVLHRGLDAQRAASVSRRITTGLLRKDLGFEGLIVTDSLDMGALRRRYSLDEAAAMALDAGADLIVCACNSPLADTAADVADMIERLSERRTCSPLP